MNTFEIIVPVYNEIECISETYKRLLNLKDVLIGFDVRYLFVNDGSRDGTLEKLIDLKGDDSSVRILDLSRNFGHQIAITAGLDYSKADYVGIIDGDLQDPPELFQGMLELLRSGYDVVYGQRESREGEGWFKIQTAKMFYLLLSRLCEVEIPRDTGDFRVINGKVLRSMQSMREKHRFLRGLVPYVGFKSVAFKYDRHERFAGVTKYPLLKMVRFALDAIFSFSTRPLKYIRYFGIGSLFVSFLLLLKIAYLKFFSGSVIPGYSSLVVILVFFSSIQIISISVLGEYIGRVFEEVKKRPLYFIDKIH
jgi:glycosyltransferase involved in cell wall biosynthesis